ncbi:hypothetical protein EJB05_26323, partial [Eragrostis curvula]
MDTEAVLAAGDRLSRLGDGILGHILSFLPAAEAARAAALSRRWRHVFASVHTLSFDEADGPSAICAVLGRNRRARVAGTPLRGLRIRFEEFSDAASAYGVNALIGYAVHDAGDELHHIDLRFGNGPICNRDYSLRRRGSYARPPTQRSAYVVTTSLLNYCTALRTLRLGPCGLSLPSSIALPSLDTLHLIRVTAGDGIIQRLVSACPRLADLSLKACQELTTLSVTEARLRKLVLKCCHNLSTVAVDSSELRTFKYRGAVPASAFLTMHGPRRVSSCKLDFCGDDAYDPVELAGLAGFLQLFASTNYMHIKAARLGCNMGHDIFSSVHGFPTLRHLELTGMVPDGDTAVVAAVTQILEWSPNLETLSMFFLPEPVEVEEKNYYAYYTEEEVHDAHSLSYRNVELPVPEGAAIPCLRERMREINFVHYQGAMAQRMLAKFLLLNAPVVDEVCCEFAQGPLWIQTQLMEEIKGWAMNKSAYMMFF